MIFLRTCNIVFSRLLFLVKWFSILEFPPSVIFLHILLLWELLPPPPPILKREQKRKRKSTITGLSSGNFELGRNLSNGSLICSSKVSLYLGHLLYYLFIHLFLFIFCGPMFIVFSRPSVLLIPGLHDKRLLMLLHFRGYTAAWRVAVICLNIWYHYSNLVIMLSVCFF